MKKILMGLAAMVLMGGVAFGNMVWAAPQINPETGEMSMSGDGAAAQAQIGKVVGNVINILVAVIGVVAIIVIIYGGGSYVLSAGDPGKIKKARQTVLYGLIGLMVALLAFAIVSFVTKRILA